MGSDAVGLERVSRVVGYKLATGNFAENSPNLPMRIALTGEANAANQLTLDTEPFQITSAQEAGERYGYGSPLYLMARILFPVQGGGVGGVPVIVYPQAEAGSATAKKIKITPIGVATDSGTHTLVISGREGLDGEFYNINIVAGDTTADITDKISDAVNNILGAPVLGTSTNYEAYLEAKWKGLTSNELNVTVNDNGLDLGITYAYSNITSGSATPSVSAALNKFGNEWNTLVINAYGTDAQTMTTLEQFNGKPSPTNPSGRYVGIVMKPFVALTGTTADDPSAITDARLNEVTIALCPAPNSDGFQFEAAANGCVLEAVTAQNTPHLDIAGQSYPDMPIPSDNDIGSMADYNNRDEFVKKGCSTVTLNAGAYVMQDFVTTYHKAGENPPQFRYVRNLIVDWNIRYGYYLLEVDNVFGFAIAADDDIVDVERVIKPKIWKGIVTGYAKDLGQRGLIADVKFMKSSIKVGLSTTNPDRLETTFNYKRTGTARILSTTGTAGFNFGTLN